MLRADFGAAPSGEGWDAIRASERLANIENLVNLGARVKLSLRSHRLPATSERSFIYNLPIRN